MQQPELASFVPSLVVPRLLQPAGPPSAPEGERFDAAALFADISGFTALAERLAQSGPGGVEELTELLNACFGELVELVAAHGGEVVKFAGDGLLALWRADGDLAAVTARAAACGLALHGYLDKTDLAAGARLSMRVGVGAGVVSAAHLGGERGRWEFVVGGPAVAQTCAAGDLARPGEVVLSPQALACAPDVVDGDPLPAGGAAGLRVTAVGPPAGASTAGTPPAADPPAWQAPAEALGAYVPRAIVDRIAAGQSAWLSELRPVSVLFVRLPELDDITETSLPHAGELVRAVQATLYDYEGSVNKLTVDDKGATLLAAFGLPPVAHEDDPVRALRAALGIRAELERLGARGAIGVATGQAFCGVVGSDRRREYTMIGRVVNLAARLMQTAADDAVCDAATRQAARARFAFQALAPRAIKGVAEPVAVFRPAGLTRASAPGSALVGRSGERAVLDRRLAALERGQGGVILIEGEAGIGKSRLVDHLAGQAAGRQLRTVTGAADAVTRNTAYHAWRAVFEALFDIADTRAPEARRAGVLEHLAGRPELQRLAPLLNDVVPLDLPSNEVTRQLEGQVRADNLRRLLVRVLRAAAAAEPLLVLLEDAHWCDSSSWALAWLVARRVPSALLVVALRPLPEPVVEYERLRQAPGAEVLRLDRLPPDDVAALLGQRLGVTSVPRPVADLIGEHAGGNPFFSEELVDALRDTGALTVGNGTCRIAPGADLQTLALPDTVQGVVLTRIDRLVPQQQLTLKVASVIGPSFAYRLLRDIHPIAADRPALPGQLDSLRRRNLVLPEAPTPEPAWAFRHVITRDVAYDLLLRAQRRQLHRRIAEWYEQQHRARLPNLAPLLAYHWSRSGVADKAVEYGALAGEQALAGGGYREAALFLTEALTRDQRTAPAEPGAADRLRRARWERQLGEAYLGLGQVGDGHAHLSRTLELLTAPLPASRRQLTATIARQLVFQALHRAVPASALRHGRRPPAECLEASRAYIRLTEVFWLANDAPGLLHAGVRALNLAERAGPSPELARAFAIMCLSAGSVPLHRLARAYGRRALATARAAGQLLPLAYVRFITSVYGTGAARWAEVDAGLAEAEAISERLGDRRLLGDTWSVQGLVGLLRGRFESARAVFQRAYEHGVRSDNVQQQVRTCIGRAEYELLAGGDLGVAVDLLHTALGLLADHPEPTLEFVAQGRLAVARLRQGDRQAALAAATAATRLDAELGRPTAFYRFAGYAGVAQVYLALRRPEEARRACAALRRFARIFPIGTPSAWLLTGRLLALSGRRGRARAAWRASLAAAERLAMPFDAALAHQELGRAARGEQRRAWHLQQAETLLGELGVTHDPAAGQPGRDSQG